mmetsp:Transcript_22692/g.57506  ORF Transcript_22692/g.57506 Transcript_22692/m.57506 type:complete len:263 (-) Transcript_22692:815-1603(-)
MLASPMFWRHTQTPYAVPSEFLFTTRAMLGHSAAAKTVYTAPSCTDAMYGFSSIMVPCVAVSSVAETASSAGRRPKRSTMCPKIGVAIAEIANIHALAREAWRDAIVVASLLYAVAMKSGCAMLLKGRIAPYINTQSAVRNQYGRVSFVIIFRETSSSSNPPCRPKYSRQTLPTLAKEDARHKSHPTANGTTGLLSHKVAIQGVETALTLLPIRAMDRFSPSARAISAPSKYENRSAFCATCSDSPPTPKSARPRSMRGHDV